MTKREKSKLLKLIAADKAADAKIQRSYRIQEEGRREANEAQTEFMKILKPHLEQDIVRGGAWVMRRDDIYFERTVKTLPESVRMFRRLFSHGSVSFPVNIPGKWNASIRVDISLNSASKTYTYLAEICTWTKTVTVPMVMKKAGMLIGDGGEVARLEQQLSKLIRASAKIAENVKTTSRLLAEAQSVQRAGKAMTR